MKPTKFPAKDKKKNEARRAKKEGVGGESKILLSAHAELRKVIFCIWITRPQSVQPANSFVVSFSSL